MKKQINDSEVLELPMQTFARNFRNVQENRIGVLSQWDVRKT